MNLHLYKVCILDDNVKNPYDSIRVMTEKDLRKEFLWVYNLGEIPHELIDDYKADPDYSKENWNDMGNLRVGTMIDIMNDICYYNCGEGYYITETDVDVQLDRKKLDQEQRYLDARYDLLCNIIQAFFEWYNKAMTPDHDDLNAFACEYSKEIDEILKQYEENKGV